MTARFRRTSGARDASSIRWPGRAAALLALACFGLALVAVNRGREVEASSKAIVEEITETNELFRPVDMGSAQRARQGLEDLADLLAQLSEATGTNVEALLSIGEEVERLAAAGHDDLGIVQALAWTAAGLSSKMSALAGAAMGGEAGGVEVVQLLQRMEELIRAINTELAAVENKLSRLPEHGG